MFTLYLLLIVFYLMLVWGLAFFTADALRKYWERKGIGFWWMYSDTLSIAVFVLIITLGAGLFIDIVKHF